MTLIGYGEDGLTYWTLTSKLHDVLNTIEGLPTPMPVIVFSFSVRVLAAWRLQECSIRRVRCDPGNAPGRLPYREQVGRLVCSHQWPGDSRTAR